MNSIGLHRVKEVKVSCKYWSEDKRYTVQILVKYLDGGLDTDITLYFDEDVSKEILEQFAKNMPINFVRRDD